ncbi:hypothetical protein EDB87DRAFT_380917 [Lactarius vividus]|nr:hypothetical protein EDB87DRAFT_380917 [Lactarius vividus]
MGFFGSKHSPSWTPGSFPTGPMPVMVPAGYPYHSSSSAVWQPQPLMMAYPYPQSPMVVQVPAPVPVQVPVQVQVPVHVPVPTPVAVSQQPAFTPGTTFTVLQHTPATNTLHLEMVPSPRVTHAIPPAPAPSPNPPPAPPARHQWQQQQPLQVYSVPSQQQHGSPPITINFFATPQQGQTPLPLGATTPGPVRPVLPESSGAPVANDDDASSGDDTVGHDDPHRNHDCNHDIQQPTPIRHPVSRATMISISSPHPVLSTLITSSPLPQFPSPYGF